jgi:hypothetical protein
MESGRWKGFLSNHLELPRVVWVVKAVTRLIFIPVEDSTRRPVTTTASAFLDVHATIVLVSCRENVKVCDGVVSGFLLRLERKLLEEEEDWRKYDGLNQDSLPFGTYSLHS